MRRLLATLVILAACSKSGDTTGPKPVASVALSAPLTTINIGQSVTLTASAVDASGNPLVGRTVTWMSSATSIATVSNGLVTGVAAGQTTITATIEGKFATTLITVVSSSPTCSGVTPLTVAVGEVHTLSAAERQQLCLSAGTTGGEYILIPFNNAAAATNIPLQLASTNTIATSGPPQIAASASRATLETFTPTNNLGAAFDARLREIERTELGPALRARGRARGAFQRSLSRSPGPISAIRNLPANPAVGTPIQLNSNGLRGCDTPQMRGGRVAAVSATAIVVVDSGAPAGGFSDAEFLSIAVTFDTLVWALDTAAFGKPFDMDGNGRILLFFTTAVNQLTLANSTTGFIGGFFFARDLFPVVANAVVPFACATSNEGEMFYLPVPDPNSLFNGFFKDKARQLTATIGTLAHEFQHLINASRRIYVTVEDVDFMETWLNEAMAHLAEELLYYRVAGLTPKSDLTLQTVTSTQVRLDAINNYQVGNLSRLSNYLGATDVNSPYSPNDVLATRGASWQLLRYALDLMPNPPNTYLKALVDSPNGTASTNGAPIFSSVFGSVFVGGLTTAVRQQMIAQFFDNTTVAIAAQYAFPSWNYRSVLGGLRDSNGNPIPFPLTPKQLVAGAAVTYSLTGGGSGYARFHVNGNTIAGITATSAGGTLPVSVELILIRTQ